MHRFVASLSSFHGNKRKLLVEFDEYIHVFLSNLLQEYMSSTNKAMKVYSFLLHVMLYHGPEMAWSYQVSKFTSTSYIHFHQTTFQP